MTAEAQTICRPARTASTMSMAARTTRDIALAAIPGKSEMPDLRGLKPDKA
jgi:hypothetical protein